MPRRLQPRKPSKPRKRSEPRKRRPPVEADAAGRCPGTRVVNPATGNCVTRAYAKRVGVVVLPAGAPPAVVAAVAHPENKSLVRKALDKTLRIAGIAGLYAIGGLLLYSILAHQVGKYHPAKVLAEITKKGQTSVKQDVTYVKETVDTLSKVATKTANAVFPSRISDLRSALLNRTKQCSETEFCSNGGHVVQTIRNRILPANKTRLNALTPDQQKEIKWLYKSMAICVDKAQCPNLDPTVPHGWMKTMGDLLAEMFPKPHT